MALTEATIKENKERFIALVSSITREGFKKDELIAKLSNSDFFEAPASTKYHCDYKGGLCYHSLNVYDQLVKLCEMEYPSKVINEGTEEEPQLKTVRTCPYSEDTIKIVALLHDFSKMNYYISDMKNVKKYSPTGSKSDSMGNFDWVTEPYYKVRESEDRFVFGSHEENSYFMISKFTPLTIDESAAILHHHGGMGANLTPADLSTQSDVYVKYPISCLLHTADVLSTFIVDGRTSSNE